MIIISTVRSSREFVEYDVRHTLGFVANPRRFNGMLSVGFNMTEFNLIYFFYASGSNTGTSSPNCCR